MSVALKLKKSEKGQIWQFLPYDEERAQNFSRLFDIPFIVARILAARGLADDTIEDFLFPKLKNLMPSPFILKDMEKAVQVIFSAVQNQEIIGIFGDYDVDGGTSSAILKKYFDMLGVKTFVHIPDRMTEGYGPNIEAFRKLAQMGASTVITVDCGSAAPDVMALAREDGLKTVILDHHLTAGETEGADATVNPNRMDDLSELGDLTAAGVCFLFCVAMNKICRDNNYFIDNSLKEPNLFSLLDLSALGTICDVAPITGLNRALVAQGLRVLQHGSNLGLRELSRIGRVTENIGTYHCGFVLGPRINAGGRVGRASAGFELLTTECPISATRLAEELDHYNTERKATEDTIKSEAISQIENQKLYHDPVIIAYSSAWHPGIVGIVASRIKENYHKPTFILGGDGDVLKGSGRSISGVDIGSAVKKAAEQNLILGGGGHKMAAGLTVREDQIQYLRDFFRAELSKDVEAARANASIKVDAELPLVAANFALFNALEKLQPFGVGNPSPVFCLRNVQVSFFKIIGENHLKVTFTDSSRVTLQAVCFRCMDQPLAKLLMQKEQKIDVLGALKRDTYHTGDNVQFIIEDVSLADIF
ncbi:MAG: single-stranded-DNA-specific exonuclease RecJ [Pseudomonadota bacterium]